MSKNKIIPWRQDGGVNLNQGAIDALFEAARGDSSIVLMPNGAGYNMCTTDLGGINRIFDLKCRPKNKPLGILCGSSGQLSELAEVNGQVVEFCEQCLSDGFSVNCILPWSQGKIQQFLPGDVHPFVQNESRASCFKLWPHSPASYVASKLWADVDPLLMFTTSANVTGTGNSTRLVDIPEPFIQAARQVVAADEYVACQQSIESGVMFRRLVTVSFLDGSTGRTTAHLPKITGGRLAHYKIARHLQRIFGDVAFAE